MAARVGRRRKILFIEQRAYDATYVRLECGHFAITNGVKFAYCIEPVCNFKGVRKAT